MNATNFHRQFMKELPGYLRTLYATREDGEHIKQVAGLYCVAGESSSMAVRFMLPNGGQILDDPEHKALGLNNLRLPFPVIALEYFEDNHGSSGRFPSSKRMVVASEVTDESGVQHIQIIPISWIDEVKIWQPYPPLWLQHGAKADDLKINGTDCFLKCHQPKEYADYKFNMGDYMNEAIALFSFLNALACSNIKTEKVPRKGPLNPRGMIPFDEYHVLTLPVASRGDSESHGWGHRSPREHLRRGHIRRLSSGATIWVNAAVVNFGIGAKIRKDYSLKNR